MTNPTANSIRVDVETAFVPAQSDPAQNRFAFAYTITIRNEGLVPAKLLTRHWLITDANGKVQEVRGEGVVGEQPYSKPGEGFRYSSGAILETPVGAMQGAYQMINDQGVRGRVPARLAGSGVARLESPRGIGLVYAVLGKPAIAAMRARRMAAPIAVPVRPCSTNSRAVTARAASRAARRKSACG